MENFFKYFINFTRFKFENKFKINQDATLRVIFASAQDFSRLLLPKTH